MRSMFSLSILASLALSACGGGGSSSHSNTTPTPTSVSGVVATGAAVSGASIAIKDRSGASCAPSTLSDANGAFTIDTTHCTAPVQITATKNALPALTSISATLSSSGTINVTPLTTALSTATLKDTPWTTAATQGTLAATLETAKTHLVEQLRASSVNLPLDFDPVHSVFTANGTGVDAAMDQLDIATGLDGAISIKDRATQQEIVHVNPGTGDITNTAGGMGLWPNYQVFEPLTANGTVRELADGSRHVTPDDTTVLMAAAPGTSNSIGTITFNQHTQTDIHVKALYDKQGQGGISPLDGVTGNERMLAQVVINCSNAGAAYVMLAKTAEIVPLSTLASGASIMMEELGVSEGCPLNTNLGPTSFVFSGNGGTITTPEGPMTAAQWAAVNSLGTDRFMAFRIVVEGIPQYGLIERGLDSNGHPFMFVHVQVP